MNIRGAYGPLRLGADALAGVALFIFLASVYSCYRSDTLRLSNVYFAQAHAAHIYGHAIGEDIPGWAGTPQVVPLAMVPSYQPQVFRNTDRHTAFMVLGAVFTMLFVANMALYRHLRSQYSTPRRRRKVR